jgi:hypothetical protein
MKAFGFLALVVGALLGAPGCDHGNSAPENEVPLTINSGPPGVAYANGLFTSVTVCVPGTSNCQILDSVLVDTGSSGLRILSSAKGGAFSLTLPQENDANGDPLVECNAFVDGYTWGSIRMADIKMGNEEAHSVQVQVIGDPSFAKVPESCSAGGGPNEDSLAVLGTYAILGVGPFAEDCGGPCAESLTAKNTENPGNVYYVCPSSGCEPVALPVALQVKNPVAGLPVDNNGVIVELSPVSAGGAPSVTGTLVFGIGTQSNNGLGGATVLSLDPEFLTFTTTYDGRSYPFSFIDSGSNALYFLDKAITGVSNCPANGAAPGFYCPPQTLNLTATNLGINGASSSVTFQVANADTLFTNPNDFAFGDLCGPSGSTASTEYFDWGLPFFFGRNVFTAIEGTAAPGGQTPYFAY